MGHGTRLATREAYLAKIERYGGENIVYGGDTADGDRATVRTRILAREDSEIPIDYRMLKRGGRWMGLRRECRGNRPDLQ